MGVGSKETEFSSNACGCFVVIYLFIYLLVCLFVCFV